MILTMIYPYNLYINIKIYITINYPDHEMNILNDWLTRQVIFWFYFKSRLCTCWTYAFLKLKRPPIRIIKKKKKGVVFYLFRRNLNVCDMLQRKISKTEIMAKYKCGEIQSAIFWKVSEVLRFWNERSVSCEYSHPYSTTLIVLYIL